MHQKYTTLEAKKSKWRAKPQFLPPKLIVRSLVHIAPILYHNTSLRHLLLPSTAGCWETSFYHWSLGLCSIAIISRSIIESLRRSQSIAKIPDRDHLLTSTLYGCNMMHQSSAGNVMSAFTVHTPTVVCNTRMRAGCGGRCDKHHHTGVCLTHSVEKTLHSVGGLLQLQALTISQAISDIRLHSRSRPLLFSKGKGAGLQLWTSCCSFNNRCPMAIA